MKRYLFDVLEIADSDNRVSNRFEKFMFVLILLNVLVTIMETVKSFREAYGEFLFWFDLFSLAVFTGEYLTRVWVCTLDGRYNSPLAGRLKFIVTPMMLLDLAVIVPFYLPFFIDVDTRFILILRMFRIARLLKLTRYSQSFHRMVRVLQNKKDDLVASLSVIIMLLIISSSLVYYAEYRVQPDKFSSIPAAFWWSIATVTTVGYGDVFPVTLMGKVMAGVTAVSGLLMIAIPTGIIGSGYMEEDQCEIQGKRCPHCGKDI